MDDAIEQDRLRSAKKMIEDGLLDDDHIAAYSFVPKWKVEEMREGKSPEPKSTPLSEQEMLLIKHFRQLSDEQKAVILETCRLFNFPFEPV